ncbi:hypothetical protein A2526_04945 [candidate division WOR-1 bacterium RIFOXYD2_FULL_36_8]|uniref:Uncharacterized protein n=1 Tax=candidate division WOR-1 bacterium RIFOXYB2_FULL_36_35 TaxID=1802578 RepID=A0A1F4S2U2_UNCSA|nr:MAG: hypothetical protein A2230_07515 [candidate division WOR-1 bacterium RIFOXYA2_FULL_36_21]OGC14765.1 MAG: hypothetical protein A2290_08730 [candidate division WOR-1 bacterium RIFOXYB2_FULL_36_35]OGC15451.1 MAG: hypothetical protein A2282_07690 [candidate division WOR-1 bacterium RIFOXYA12_FULL_36_13]OGC38783.1 MAG: hypothetical protein A2526_04945 [candidate division WOR-1 bacterium RIFOXYD2_FULL_36_8]
MFRKPFKHIKNYNICASFKQLTPIFYIESAIYFKGTFMWETRGDKSMHIDFNSSLPRFSKTGLSSVWMIGENIEHDVSKGFSDPSPSIRLSEFRHFQEVGSLPPGFLSCATESSNFPQISEVA